MATLRDIRRRIRSIGNTSQITRAMELVAASRMRRAQQRLAATRPYAEKIRELLAGLTGQISGDEDSVPHPLLEQRPIQRSVVIVFTTDRGLCGALNSNLVRRTLQLAREARAQGRELDVVTIGRKGPQRLRNEPVRIVSQFHDIGYQPTLEETADIARFAIESYLERTYDEVRFLYPRFVSMLRQDPTDYTLLPIAPPRAETADEDDGAAEQVRRDISLIYEPSAPEVLAQLLPRYVGVVVYETILESLASELSARMVAMRNATENATELLRDLQLNYNKARQAAITREMIDVTSGMLTA